MLGFFFILSTTDAYNRVWALPKLLSRGHWKNTEHDHSWRTHKDLRTYVCFLVEQKRCVKHLFRLWGTTTCTCPQQDIVTWRCIVDKLCFVSRKSGTRMPARIPAILNSLNGFISAPLVKCWDSISKRSWPLSFISFPIHLYDGIIACAVDAAPLNQGTNKSVWFYLRP
jgi:hypothetical protein